MLDPLSRLAIIHGTDKFGYHDYTPNYHHLFEAMRTRDFAMLEIGVGGYADDDRGGQSLATWRDYFSAAEIVGIDIQSKSLALGPRVHVRRGSQIDPEFMDEMVGEYGPFTIIIDDGSHRNEHVVASFDMLWPGLEPGGIYVVEDVQTAFIERFGGSMALSQPNSVGKFADLFARLGTDDPATQSIAGIERFHNMIALRKRLGDARSSVATSTTLDALNGGSVILAVGPGTVGAQLGKARATEPAALAKGGANCDAIVIAASVATPDLLRAAMARLKIGGALIIEGHPAPGSDMARDLFQRFVEIDHREISAQFPDAPIDPVAKETYAIERYDDGTVIVKKPNDYPSNFKFDAAHPQAAAALREMEAVLETSGEESGLAQYASIVTLTRSREAAKPWLDRLDTMNATGRVYFQLASALAQRERDIEKAAAIVGRALEIYPADSGFSHSLGNFLVSLGKNDEAREVVATALATHERDINLHLIMARILARSGMAEQAIVHAQRAVALSPGTRRPQAKTLLAEILIGQGRADEAETELRAAVATKTPYAAKAFRTLSAVLKTKGEIEEAAETAQKAMDLSPQTREYQTWRAGFDA